MKREYIVYKCKICNCNFAVERSYIKHAEDEHRYLTCPLDGRHTKINVISRMELKSLMEERKAVEL